MNTHDIAGIYKSNIYQVNAIYHTHLCCTAHKVVIHRNYRYPNVISIGNRNQILEIPAILSFLCNYN